MVVFGNLQGGQDKPQISFEDQWPKMQPTIVKLLRQESVNRPEWQDMFYSVHQVCLWDEKAAAKIYKALQENIAEFIGQAQQRVLAHSEDQALLKAYINEWRKFFDQCSYLPKPFIQVEVSLNNHQSNNSVGKKHRGDDSNVRKLMLDSWNHQIFMNIKSRLQASAMKLVRAERNGEAFDSQLVIGVRESYVNLCSDPEDKLKIYRDNFEKSYIEATESFYQVKATQYLQENGVQNYMRYAFSKLKEEETRAKKYLEPASGSIQALMDCCVGVLVTAFKDQILAECPGMIKDNETEKLQLVFKLMDRVPDGIGSMLNDLEDHITTAGLDDMKLWADVITQDSEKYVERLLELFRRFSTIVSSAFCDDPRFLTSRDKAYKLVVNDTSVFRLDLPTGRQGPAVKTQPESRCPELLANYCDLLLRKTPLSKRLTSDDIEARLRDVLLVLKYVQNKDVFMRYHKAHLTRRLILDASADSEKEENMVEWLREVGMPADYVNKLAHSINIKILNAGAWARGSERISVSLPLELEDYIPEVEEFYRRKHNGRKLQWYHHMATARYITFSNSVGRFDLDVTTFQMAVLFAWNQRPKDKIPYENLRLATELPDPELRKTLWSLVAFPKVKRQLLMYSPEVQSPKEFAENSTFWVNQEFTVM
ncbi:Cullin-5 [Orchesella cincta]|uniref:Cullin-5 n=1 Tax=Orchesella cincta TaxID=48709 RepID=A0A1D2M438_ORCCI|nr:Cullin-5 [Orchesella cincta]